jgi:hypothetical protein
LVIMAVKTWVWVVVGVVVTGLIGLIVLAGAGMYYFARHVETQPMPREQAEQAFEEARAPFAKQRPLIEIDEDDRVKRLDLDRKPAADARPPEYLHILAFDPEDERIVRLRIPFWMLKLGDQGTINLGRDGREIDLDKLELKIADLERFGPTLILDHRGSRGERVLVWSQ